MYPDTPNPDENNGAGNGSGAGGGNKDGNANQGGDNSQGNRGGNQGGDNGGGNANRGANQGGNQGGGDEDYKTKFSESSKEANRLLEVLKANGIDPKTGKKAEGNAGGDNNANAGRGNGGQGDAGGLPFFTDADLEAAFPSFVTMSEAEKNVLRNVGSFPKMARMVAEMHDKLTFTEQLEALKALPENKIIADNEKEFKAFAYKDENLKVPIEILADAFIGMKSRGNNGNGGGNQGDGNQGGGNNRGMERGAGGGNQGSGDGIQEMTPEAARELRTKDPRKYNKLAASGKLKIVADK